LAVIAFASCFVAIGLSLWGRQSTDYAETWFGICGSCGILIASILAFVYRHYKISIYTIIIALNVPIWCVLYFIFYPGLFIEQLDNIVPILLVVLIQLPLILVAILQSKLSRSSKILGCGILGGIVAATFTSGLICDIKSVASVPRFSEDAMQKDIVGPKNQIRDNFIGKRLIITGTVTDADGLLANDWLMDGTYLNFSFIDRISDSETVTAIGTCDGVDQVGRVDLEDCRIVHKFLGFEYAW